MIDTKTAEIILKAVAEAVENKDREIFLLRCELESVKKKLAAAEEAATDIVAKEAAAMACGKLCKTRIETREEKNEC